jgi:hypothetical protein
MTAPAVMAFICVLLPAWGGLAREPEVIVAPRAS